MTISSLKMSKEQAVHASNDYCKRNAEPLTMINTAEEPQEFVLVCQRGQGVPTLAMQMGLRLAAAMINNEIQLTGDENLIINRERSASGTNLVVVTDEADYHVQEGTAEDQNSPEAETSEEEDEQGAERSEESDGEEGGEQSSESEGSEATTQNSDEEHWRRLLGEPRDISRNF